MDDEQKKMEIRWTASGDLAVEHEGNLMVRFNFYDAFHTSMLKNIQKLELAHHVIMRAMNDPDLSGEDKKEN